MQKLLKKVFKVGQNCMFKVGQNSIFKVGSTLIWGLLIKVPLRLFANMLLVLDFAVLKQDNHLLKVFPRNTWKIHENLVIDSKSGTRTENHSSDIYLTCK